MRLERWVSARNVELAPHARPRAKPSGSCPRDRTTKTPATGAVYVFDREATTWTQTAFIKAHNTNVNVEFGEEVALSADGLVLAIGPWLQDSAAVGVDGTLTDDFAIDSGAVYVYVRDADTWSYRSYVKAPNTGAGDIFGSNAALSSNGHTLAVGAGREDSAAIDLNGNQATTPPSTPAPPTSTDAAPLPASPPCL